MLEAIWKTLKFSTRKRKYRGKKTRRGRKQRGGDYYGGVKVAAKNFGKDSDGVPVVSSIESPLEV